jgi:hypothetical protein
MPHDKSRYPADWPAISRRIRFDRAGNKCEWCGARNHEPHPVTGGMVTLTVAHYPDSDPMNVAEDNLHALCNSCHNGADAPMRVQHAKETRLRKKLEQGQMALIEVTP